MNKITSHALTLSLIVLVSVLSNCNPALCGTYTNGLKIVNSDMTWTKENSPCILSETITISNTAQVVIEPGVIVNLNGNTLKVNGTLIANGTQDQKIFFKNGSIILDSQSSKIDNAVLFDSINITINSGEPVISNSYIQGVLILNGGSPLINANIIDARVFVKDGSPTISNNIISDGIHADAKGGPVTISNNELTSKSGFNVIYVQGIHADIVGNKIVGNNNEHGIDVEFQITSALIEGNQISDCTSGIWSSAGGVNGDVDILGNVIFNNDEGLHIYHSVTVKDNTIMQNRIGVRASQVSVFSQNNLQNNSELNLDNMPAFDMDATNNWWGTADAQSINQTIIGERAQVFFVPFLSEPNPNAPKIPENNPIVIPTAPSEPTVTPTIPLSDDNSSVESQTEPFPTVQVIVVLATISILACVSVLAYLKRRK